MDNNIERLRRKVLENPGDKMAKAALNAAQVRGGILHVGEDEIKKILSLPPRVNEHQKYVYAVPSTNRNKKRMIKHLAGICSKNNKCRFCRRGVNRQPSL